MMFRNKLPLCGLILIAYSPLLMAVTESDIWVPKRYTAAKNKLLSTAVEAERTTRCAQVIQGSLVVEKTTPHAYYFVVTCRDKNRKSYNLSYSYPVNGAEPILLNEQFVVAPEPVVIAAESAEPTISANRAWPLCIAALKKKTRTMLDVLMLEDNPRPSDDGLARQVFDIPFDAKNPQGLLLKYQGHCEVDAAGELTLAISGRKS